MWAEEEGKEWVSYGNRHLHNPGRTCLGSADGSLAETPSSRGAAGLSPAGVRLEPSLSFRTLKQGQFSFWWAHTTIECYSLEATHAI